MAGEVTEEPVELAGEQEEHDADFAAGFGGTEAPTATPAPTPAPTPEPSPAPAPEFVQITREEWEATRQRAAKVEEIEATHRQRFDQAFGKLGGLERKLAELQQATPAGEVVQVSEADFEDLAKDYPELAALTAKGLTKALGKFKGGGMDPEALEKVVSERIQAARASDRAELIDSTLNAILGTDDWVSEGVNTEAYKDAAKLMRSFARHRNAPAPTPTPAPTPAPVSARERQIAAAVPPRGDGGHPPGPSEDDEFNAGFKYRSG
jgi:hypothetical protein